MSWIDEARGDGENGWIDALDRCVPRLRAEAARLLSQCSWLDVRVEDLVHEVYIRVRSRFEQFRGTTEEEWCAWMGRILKNVLIDEIRRANRPAAHGARTGKLSGVIDPHQTPRTLAERKDLAEAVRRGLDGLSPGNRLVFEMHVFDEVPLPLIAELLDRKYDAIRRRFDRAREQLRASIGLIDSSHVRS